MPHSYRLQVRDDLACADKDSSALDGVILPGGDKAATLMQQVN